MKLLFDIMGATEHSGGMRLHATELIAAWKETFPDDKIIVLGGKGIKELYAGSGVKVISWPNESIVGRSLGQLVVSAFQGLVHRVDYVVSLSPIVSPLIPRKKSACFQHDWRHKKNPHEFPSHQRFYRKLWEISAANAGVNLCISKKAADETREYVPRSKVALAENGRDHARRWGDVAVTGSPPNLVTYGHHNNKRPELVMEAFATLTPEQCRGASLTILGARGEYAEDLRRIAESLGIRSSVVLPGFVTNEQYREYVANAAAIVMASSDEGFGLPAAEAQFFGIPAVVTNDSGMTDIFGSYLISAEPDAPSLATALTEALDRGRGVPAADLHTWADTARQLRTALLAI